MLVVQDEAAPMLNLIVSIWIAAAAPGFEANASLFAMPDGHFDPPPGQCAVIFEAYNFELAPPERVGKKLDAYLRAHADKLSLGPIRWRRAVTGRSHITAHGDCKFLLLEVMRDVPDLGGYSMPLGQFDPLTDYPYALPRAAAGAKSHVGISRAKG